jgi:DNA-binding SARP family transcriptional activator
MALIQARQACAARSPFPEPIDAAISRTLEDTNALITTVPLPFAVELAVRAHALGFSGGQRALELLQHQLHEPLTVEMEWQESHGDEIIRKSVHDLLNVHGADDGPRVRIEVLGTTRVLVDGRPAGNASARRARVRQLLALLVVEPRLRRERAMALLWPELDPTAASRNLRVTLTYLRQLFRENATGDSGGRAPDERFLFVDSSSIHLLTHPGLEVDLWELDTSLARAAQARAGADFATHANALSDVVALWHGEPLIDLQGVEEMRGEVTRVHTAMVDATLALGEIRLTEGHAAESVRYAQRVLAVDPYIERAHRLAIAAQMHLGDHPAARQAARRMHEALAQVGAGVSNGTSILLRRMAALDVSLA